MDVLNFINNAAWVFGNILVMYIIIALVAFVIGYYILFDPKATTAGKFIFRFFLSLVGVIGLAFLSTFIHPENNRSWTYLPEVVDKWKPIVRLIVYGYVAFTISSLAVLLFLRKWRPNRLKAAPDITMLKVRNVTSDSPVIPLNKK